MLVLGSLQVCPVLRGATRKTGCTGLTGLGKKLLIRRRDKDWGQGCHEVWRAGICLVYLSHVLTVTHWLQVLNSGSIFSAVTLWKKVRPCEPCPKGFGLLPMGPEFWGICSMEPVSVLWGTPGVGMSSLSRG